MKLAEYAGGCRFKALPDMAKTQLKIRLLDTLGCALAAVPAPQSLAIRSQIEEFDRRGPCSLIGGGAGPPDRAAFYNGALIRFLDCNDSYVARGETCQPSVNSGAVLAATEIAGRSGEALLDGLTASYQVQCLLADNAPVTKKGFDVATHGSYAAAAGAARAIGLNPETTANAVAIAGAASNPLAVRNPGKASDWKRLAHPAAAGSALYAVLMAARGITGPANVLEGSKGFMESVAGGGDICWSSAETELITRTAVRPYSASVQAQSCIEGILELRRSYQFAPAEVRHVDIEAPPELFGEVNPGAADSPARSREQAVESLPFGVASALVDGELTPSQYTPEKIRRSKVQDLAGRIRIRPWARAGGESPGPLPCHIRVLLSNGCILKRHQTDFEGFPTRPLDFGQAYRKFRQLTYGQIGESSAMELADTVARLEALKTPDLTKLLSRDARKRPSV